MHTQIDNPWSALLEYSSYIQQGAWCKKNVTGPKLSIYCSISIQQHPTLYHERFKKLFLKCTTTFVFACVFLKISIWVVSKLKCTFFGFPSLFMKPFSWLLWTNLWMIYDTPYFIAWPYDVRDINMVWASFNDLPTWKTIVRHSMPIYSHRQRYSHNIS